MAKKLFVTGTDTHVGKTYQSVGLLNFFNQWKYSTLGMKPIASGVLTNQLSDDVLALQQAASDKLDYHLVNAFTFKLPLAPSIAADKEGVYLTVDAILQRMQFALNYPTQIQVIEGVGGWCVPLNKHETMIDLAIALKAHVILVIDIRLGCFNHAMLTASAIEKSGLPFLGWIANCLSPLFFVEENIHTLQQILQVRCLGIVGRNDLPQERLDREFILRTLF